MFIEHDSLCSQQTLVIWRLTLSHAILCWAATRKRYQPLKRRCPLSSRGTAFLWVLPVLHRVRWFRHWNRSTRRYQMSSSARSARLHAREIMIENAKTINFVNIACDHGSFQRREDTMRWPCFTINHRPLYQETFISSQNDILNNCEDPLSLLSPTDISITLRHFLLLIQFLLDSDSQLPSSNL